MLVTLDAEHQTFGKVLFTRMILVGESRDRRTKHYLVATFRRPLSARVSLIDQSIEIAVEFDRLDFESLAMAAALVGKTSQ